MQTPSADPSKQIQFSYDPLDNLRTAALGIATNTYNYDTSNKLVSLARSSGGTATYVTDAQSNIRDDGRLTYNFDAAHRLMETDDKLSATLKEKYRYDAQDVRVPRRAGCPRATDGLGRRVYQERPGGAQTLSIYSQAGQMLFRFDNLPTQRTREHVYLAGSLVATIDHDWPSNTVTATNYQHTDALGSPAAVTAPDRHIVERTYYTPYGLPINHAVEGVGYTGHVMDSATALTYMQQRYYDPAIGRFLSVDPIPASPNSGANFNSYWYANNNPYRFTDPDGRLGTGGCGGYQQPACTTAPPPPPPPPPPACNAACMKMRAVSDHGISAGNTSVIFIVAEKPNPDSSTGHVFLGGVGAGGQPEAYGFYPAAHDKGAVIDGAGKGEVRNDTALLSSALNGNSNFAVRKFEVNPAAYASAMSSMKSFAKQNDYALFSKNCANAVYASTFQAGITNGILANFPLVYPQAIYDSIKSNP